MVYRSIETISTSMSDYAQNRDLRLDLFVSRWFQYVQSNLILASLDKTAPIRYSP